jgi:alpha-1,3-rhamnosyl/mannosyltransferase
MRVVVNQLAALGQKTGVGHYTRQLFRCLRLQAAAGEIEGFPTGWVRDACKAFTRLRPYLEASGPRRGSGLSGRPGWQGRLLHWLRTHGRALVGHYFRHACARRGFDLYHEPNFIPFPSACPTLMTVHDLSVLLHPDWHPADRVAFHETHFHRSVARCVHFLTVSEFSRQEMIRTLSLPPERVTRTYNGIRPGLGPLPAEEVAATLRRLGLPRRYLLYLGTIEPRKNVLLLLKAYCSLEERLRARCPLLLVGNWGWNSGEVADFFHTRARDRGVLHLGYIREEHLAAVYNGARALVYPSLYEGFGLPPLEMMACGGAVLASTAGALVETVGRKADLIPPGDLDGWRQAMARVLADDDWWQSLRRGVRAVARSYTWERCAAETLRVYRDLAAGRQPGDLETPVRRAAG